MKANVAVVTDSNSGISVEEGKKLGDSCGCFIILGKHGDDGVQSFLVDAAYSSFEHIEVYEYAKLALVDNVVELYCKSVGVSVVSEDGRGEVGEHHLDGCGSFRVSCGAEHAVHSCGVKSECNSFIVAVGSVGDGIASFARKLYRLAGFGVCERHGEGPVFIKGNGAGYACFGQGEAHKQGVYVRVFEAHSLSKRDGIRVRVFCLGICKNGGCGESVIAGKLICGGKGVGFLLSARCEEYGCCYCCNSEYVFKHSFHFN